MTAQLTYTPAVLTRARLRVSTRTAEDRLRRRLMWVWGLLFFNVLEFTTAIPVLVPIPSALAKVLTQGSLAAALVLALTLYRPPRIRPNVYLMLLSVLAVVALAVSLQRYFGLGSVIRGVRLVEFVSALWLTTPFWGRRDLLLVRAHLKAEAVVIGTIVIGLVFHPGAAIYQGRLVGTIWPIWAPQVGHYTATALGLCVLLWYGGHLSGRWFAIVGPLLLTLLLLSRTRTALLCLVIGLLIASASLFLENGRVRRTVYVTVVVCVVIALVALPVIFHFLARGQDSQEIAQLSGRSKVWHALLTTPRPRINVLFGFGLSNKSFGGLSIDDSWLATYQDLGLFGDVIDGLILLSLLCFAWLRPRGLPRAIALFLVTYCIIASYTEVGLGDASPYLLDLTVAAAMLSIPRTERRRL